MTRRSHAARAAARARTRIRAVRAAGATRRRAARIRAITNVLRQMLG